MSDTPMTDKHVSDGPFPSDEYVTAYFARELERENARLTAGIKDVVARPDFSSPESMLYRLRDLLPNV